jgi:protein-S-isoprenylcysteine O-methyltransferase Ste14
MNTRLPNNNIISDGPTNRPVENRSFLRVTPTNVPVAERDVHGRRVAGFAFGIATQLLFAVTVWHLYWFLKGPDRPTTLHGDLWLDGALAILFAIPHSLLLYPAIRSRLSRFIAQPFYGCFYCVATCCSLLPLFAFWQPNRHVIWSTAGTVQFGIQAAFGASWVALFYSLSLTGLGYQTGWTPWWRWLRHYRAVPRPFQPRGAYRYLRHPVYLSFLGLIWFTPLMTLDRLVLAGAWSVYIAAGSCLKDARLVFYLGDTYRAYQARVPGFIGIPIGPWGRVPMRKPPPAAPQPENRSISDIRKAA